MVKWKSGIGFYKGIDAEKVYLEITGLGDRYTPEEILEYAKDENTELNKCFTWDDTEAAEKWRLQQARQLIANLVIEIEDKEYEPMEYRIIQSQGRGKPFAKVMDIVRIDGEYADLLRRAKAELQAFKNRYQKIVELEGVIEEIEKLF